MSREHDALGMPYPRPAKDYIGPDPVAWVIRLRDVARDSQFTVQQKSIIEYSLSKLQNELDITPWEPLDCKLGQ